MALYLKHLGKLLENNKFQVGRCLPPSDKQLKGGTEKNKNYHKTSDL